MKKVLAIILSIAMLFGVLAMNTFAATTTPKVTVDSTDVLAGENQTFTITLSDFSEVAGMDIDIVADANATLKSVAADNGLDLVKGTNYTVSDDNKTIKIVELMPKVATVKLTVTADFSAAAKITVTGELAENGETLFAPVVNETGSITIKEKADGNVAVDEGEESKTLTASSDKYFIPYGSVYSGDDSNANHIDKNTDGSFTLTAGTSYTYTQFLKPASGIMTFGVSNATIKVDEADTSALRFGTYCSKSKTGLGTMVIAGDVDALLEKFAPLSLSDKEIAERLNSVYTSSNPDGKYTVVKMNFNGSENQIRIYKVAQTKYMWDGEDAIEYAVSVYNLEQNDKCVAIGYHTENNASVFADAIKGK